MIVERGGIDGLYYERTPKLEVLLRELDDTLERIYLLCGMQVLKSPNKGNLTEQCMGSEDLKLLHVHIRSRQLKSSKQVTDMPENTNMKFIAWQNSSSIHQIFTSISNKIESIQID